MNRAIGEDKAPGAFKRIDNMLKSNNGGDGFYVGDSVS